MSSREGVDVHRSKLGSRVWLVLTALILVALPAVPAAADHSPPPASPVAGAGTLHGTELVEDQGFLGHPCFAATKHIYGLRGEGTYHGRTPEGQEVVYRAELGEGQPMYEGPLHVEVENVEPFHHGPGGTHGGDSGCTPATAGTPVTANFRICSPRPLEFVEVGQPRPECLPADHIYRLDGSGNRLPCTGAGSFVRKGMAEGNWHAEWTLDADCVVVGNEAGTAGEGVAPRGTAHTHRGFHAPCGGGCDDNFKVDFAQHLPVPGLALTLGGPAGGPIGQPVTLTAGVTDDGLPLAGAPVAFVVDGPGPGAPPAEPLPTDANGRASFTFTAAVEGDYVVTASTTWPTYPGQVVSDTHSVRFTLPAPRMTMAGLSHSATEDPLTVTAIVVDESNPVPADPAHDPVPGVPVQFAVTGPGQASPATGTVVTGVDGRAAFTFTGERAGDYTVAASATYASREISATHSVHLAVKTLGRVGAIEFPDLFSSSSPLGGLTGGFASALIDPAGNYAYFSTGGGSGQRQIVKLDLRTFERVGTLTLPSRDESNLTSAVIDPAGTYAYFGTGTRPGRVVKVDLNTFQRVGAITLGSGEDQLRSAVIDPAGTYAYFGTETEPGRVVKVDLNTFQRVDAITLPQGENNLTAAVVDPAGHFAYFGTGGPGRLVKVDLSTFQRVGSIALSDDIDDGEGRLLSAVIDPAGRFAYFGTSFRKLIKFDLVAFQRAGTLVLPSNVFAPSSAVIDLAGHFAYFGAAVDDVMEIFTYGGWLSLGPLAFALVYSPPMADGVVKVDLERFELAHVLALEGGEEGLTSAVIEPDGSHAYFGTTPRRGSPYHEADDLPAKVVKTSLTRPPAAWLVAGDDAYPTDYLTPLSVPAPGVLANDADTEDGDPLTAHSASDPPGGSVSLNPDGSFTYTPDAGFSGTDTFTYVASDGMDYSAPATVTITVEPPPEGVQSVVGSAYGFFTDVSLFGGPSSTRGGYGSTCGQAGQPACAQGESPAVELAPAGGELSATDPDGNAAVYGPAYIFENHGPLTVSAQGSTGTGGSVSASAVVEAIQDNDPFHAHGPDGRASSTCSASETTLGGSTRIVNGRLVTRTDPSSGAPTEEITFPHTWDPAPNTTYEGTLDHVGDRWRIVFNEQLLGPESITVNAVHLYLLGPTAVGEMVIGQSRCGVETAQANAPPTAADDAYVATAGRPLTVAAPGPLANDADPEGGALRASPLAPVAPADFSSGNWTFPSDPAHGTLTLNPDGSFTYTPEEGYEGPDSFPYLVSDPRGSSDEGMVTITVEPPPPGLGPLVDFDGDSRSDLGLYRPSTGAWYLRPSGGAATSTAFGTSGDVAVPADYDGDGQADLGVYRPSTGAWFLRQSSGGDTSVRFGADGDVPVPADYDGDAKADIAVFRPSTGAWYLRQSGGGTTAATYGTSGDVAVPADYDGDGKADLGVYRPSTGAWYLRQSSGGDTSVRFGADGDVPVPADYDGDAQADIAVFRPSTGAWYLRQSSGGTTAATFGTSGDVPVPADYDGDGKADVGVYRPSTGAWFLRQSSGGDTSARFGTAGDVPLSLPAAIYRAFF